MDEQPQQAVRRAAAPAPPRRRAAVACLCGALAAACGAAGPPDRAASAPLRFPVQLEPVAEDDVRYEIAAVGTLDAFERVPVTARVAGVVQRLRFVEGDAVRAGQPLADIEVPRYVLAVRAAAAARDRAAAAAAAAAAVCQRRERAAVDAPGLLPAEELEGAQHRQQIAAAEAREKAVAWEQARLDLADARIAAPHAGVIESREASTGQHVAVGTVLATLVRRDPLLVRFSVRDGEAARLRPQQPLQFVAGDAAEAHAATIIHIAQTADPRSRSVAVVARVAADADPGLRPGAFVQVRAQVGAGAAAPVVPEAAVRPTERGFVAYVVEDGRAIERRLRLGMRAVGGRIEVLEGLQVGEQLVVRGAEPLRDGAPVQPAGGAAAADGEGR